MADVVLAQQQVGRPVRLPAGLGEAARRGELVLVAVEQVEGGVGVEPADHLGQGMGLQDVVVVQEADVVARGQAEGGVGGGRDARALLQPGQLDAASSRRASDARVARVSARLEASSARHSSQLG